MGQDSRAKRRGEEKGERRGRVFCCAVQERRGEANKPNTLHNYYYFFCKQNTLHNLLTHTYCNLLLHRTSAFLAFSHSLSPPRDTAQCPPKNFYMTKDKKF